MELLDTRKGVLCYLQELPVHALVEHSGPQSSHFVFCIRDQYYLAYWQRGLQDLNDAILFSDNPQNMHGSQSGTHISIRGGIKFLLGDFEGALQDFDLAYNLNTVGHRSTLLLERALAKCMLARYSDAMQDIFAVIAINPNLNDIQELQTRVQQILYQPPCQRVQLTYGGLIQRPQLSNQHNSMPIIPDLLTGDECSPAKSVSICTISKLENFVENTGTQSEGHANANTMSYIRNGYGRSKPATAEDDPLNAAIYSPTVQDIDPPFPTTDSPASFCGSTVSVSSMLSTSPSKPSVVSASCVSSKPSSIVLEKKNSPFTEKDQSPASVDVMRAQSPLRIHSLHKNIPDAFDLEAAVYKFWLEKHPSALSSFDNLIRHAHKKHVVVFLDYDGTLSPTVEDPERAFMSTEMRASVKDLASCFPTAVISGRSRPKVYEFVQLTELHYAGSHGMDIMGPAKSSDGFRVIGTKSRDKRDEVVLFQPASEYLPLINKVFTALIETTKFIKGAKVEENKFCVTVYFRRVKEEHWEALAALVGNVLKDHPSLKLTHGRKTLEVRPSISWDIGKAVDFLLKSLGFKDTSDVFPLYLGDDEDGFRTINGSKHGSSILVSSVPKSTDAKLSLQDPSEVMLFLRRLVQWKKWELENRNSLQKGAYNHRLLPTSSKLQHDEEAVAKISTNFADVVFDGTALKSVRYSRSDPGIRNPNSDRHGSRACGGGLKINPTQNAEPPPQPPSRKPGSSTYYGVRFRPDLNKWVAEIRVAEWKAVDKKVWLGSFDTEQGAARGVDLARKLLKCKKKHGYNLPNEELDAYSGQIPCHLDLTNLTSPTSSMFKAVMLFIKRECQEYAASFDSPDHDVSQVSPSQPLRWTDAACSGNIPIALTGSQNKLYSITSSTPESSDSGFSDSDSCTSPEHRYASNPAFVF